MTPTEYRKMCGERLQKARLEKGLTLAQLYAKLGYHRSKSNLGNYEAGLRLPPPWEVQKLANALDVRAGYLLCLDEGQIVLQPQEEALLRYWRALPENERIETANSIEVRALVYLRASEAESRREPKRAVPVRRSASAVLARKSSR